MLLSRNNMLGWLALVGSAPLASAGILPDHQKNSSWYTEGQVAVSEQAAVKTLTRAKNVILFVGDGMGVSTLTAARILEGQRAGNSGEENYLSFEHFPFTALAKTYNTNQQTPDSAGTMTAMMSGLKTKAGVIGVREGVSRGDCASSKGLETVTLLEQAEIDGRATGIISTARITHATPAATYAKSPERNWEDISDMPQSAIDAGCKDIADQLLNFSYGDGIDVVMGGGRRHFLPKDAAFNSADAASAIEGDRTDNRDLTAEWKAKYPQGQYVISQAEFDAVDTRSSGKLLGLFNESHMRYEADRSNDTAGEPSLSEMTTKAIDLLDNNDKGFFLMVESGRIDHGHHAGNAYNALSDAIELSNAVKAAAAATSAEDTLIIVTADHSHVFTIAGYPTRGNPILGKVVANDASGTSTGTEVLAKDGFPYTTLGYTNGRGFADLGAETDADKGYDQPVNAGTRTDLTAVDTTTPGFHQEALVPRSSETHAGEDVTIHAQGPGAQLFQGVLEQSVVYHVMQQAMFGNQ